MPLAIDIVVGAALLKKDILDACKRLYAIASDHSFYRRKHFQAFTLVTGQNNSISYIARYIGEWMYM